MNEVRPLEEKFGGCWRGVTFGKDDSAGIRRAARPMRFCEAIAASRTGPIALTSQLLACPGGSRSLRSNTEEETIAQAMAATAPTAPAIAVAKTMIESGVL